MLSNLIVSAEAIQVQENDYSITKLSNLIDELRVQHRTGKLKYDGIRKNKGVADILNKMEDVILERFGLSIRITGDNDGPAIYTPLTPTINSHMVDSMASVQLQQDYISKYITDLSTIDPKDIDNVQDGFKAMLSDLGRSTKRMLELGNYGKLKVDDGKAYIDGADTLTSYMMIPWRRLFENAKSNREVLAVVYHEIGHAYNSIAYANHTAASLITLSDALIEASTAKDGEFTIPKFLDIKNKNAKQRQETLRDILKGEDGLLNMAMSNNEITADQFAARFGFASEIATMLFGNTYKSTTTLVEAISVSLIIGAASLIIAAQISISAILAVLYFGWFSMLIYITHTLGKMSSYDFPYQVPSIGQIYDEPTERLAKLSKDLRRQLRTAKLSKDTTSKILKQIDIIDNTMKHYNNEPGLLSSLYIYMVKGDDASIVNYLREVEEIMESPLYGDKQKLVKLLG